GATPTPGGEDLLPVSAGGKTIRFSEEKVRPQGLAATGMRGMALQEDDHLIALARPQGGEDLLIVTEWGFAKRTALEEYPTQGRGGQGAVTVDASKREAAGVLVAAQVAPKEGHLFLCTTAGRGYVAGLKDVPRLPRASWGRLVTRTRRGALVPLEGEERIASAFVMGATVAPLEERAAPSPAPARKPLPKARSRAKKEVSPSPSAKEAAPAKKRRSRAQAEPETPAKAKKKGTRALQKSTPEPAKRRARREAEEAPQKPSSRSKRRTSQDG
ncbi:MAG: hypothetical protein H5T66_13410, partial [Chloroflexi bacterium]|nr:hypothetical protein [Chloroflexota bacterium]